MSRPAFPVVMVDPPTHVENVPDPPDYLRGRAREVWPSVVSEMMSRAIYDTDVREQVAGYCAQVARFLDAEDHIAENGTIVEATRVIGRGEMQKFITEEVPNPNIAVSDRAFDRMLRMAEQLGLTPVSRRKVAKVKKGPSGAAASRWLRTVA